MRTALGYLNAFLVLCSAAAWAFSAYYQFLFGRAWRRQSGRPDSWLLYQPTIPEPYRTYRRRSFRAGLAFVALVALGAIVNLAADDLLPF